MTQANAVVWFEIYVADMARAVAFYEAVTGKKLEEIKDPTGEMQMMGFPSTMEGYGAAGALVKMADVAPGGGGTMVYLGCEDCAVEEARVAGAGGKVIRPKFAIGQYGFVALCEDSEGNMFGLHSMA